MCGVAPFDPTPDPSPEKEGRLGVCRVDVASPLLFRGGVGGGVERRGREKLKSPAARGAV